jgi:ubiquinol-cytochrome c reductase subunit 7
LRNWREFVDLASIPEHYIVTGLRYDDLYDDLYDLDVKEALARLPKAETDARNQRLKRAIDQSMKHTYLPKEIQVGVYV